ncbi:probable Histone-lysine N-methyltransferase ATXR5 isoform X2 [Magnolia sinica]|uniref:probable Histone-lysine N-methyltransferase ATXR5 isoform X2 n=1 Tax=Magnolia sinica TaxID=86752 RepID=UPI00265A5D75|nr:probable Histone-lysine N-methyltransferase ATXR5 isoform X2 [Magnolia sinica]
MSPSDANIFPFNASVRKRTEAPRCLCSPHSFPSKKYKSLAEIMQTAPIVVMENEDEESSNDENDDNDVRCEQCMSGDGAEEMLLCDKCDKGYHMYCLRPIIVRVPTGSWFCPNCSRKKRLTMFPLLQTKIVDFFRIQRGLDALDKCTSPLDARKRRRRSTPLVMCKKRRRLLPFSPTEDPVRRLEQMGSLATALTALRMEFSNELTYMPGMAPRSANQARLERGGMQVLSKEDTETLEFCSAMCRRGEWPPLVVVFDSCEGFTVEADRNIKDLTLITEYTGDVDYIKNRELDDCDSMMTLLLSTNSSESLVICPDKRGNIARFINGINNHTPDGRKKQNLKCVRYNVNGECRALLVATRDIAKGERLYYDYNGYEQEYPTQHFI